jgi:hypothetical protein
VSGATSPFQYALLRAVPRVERGEFVNVGVVLYQPGTRFLGARFHLDEGRLQALDPALKVEDLRPHLEAACRVCKGGAGAGEIGQLPLRERFGWLVAPRSTVVQPSPVHTGLSDDPEEALSHLLEVMVLPPKHP